MTTAQISPSTGRLMSVAEAARIIEAGRYLWVAGEEALLRRLPRGNWIGGTIPYFQGPDGGQASVEQVFVGEVAVYGEPPRIRFHDVTSLAGLCAEAPEHGYSFLIVPAFSAVHSLYARNAPGFEDMFVKPVVGWVSGVQLERIGEARPAVVDGRSGEFDSERALVMHVPLPADRFARIEIVNRYEQGDGDRIRFPDTGFSASTCLVNGEQVRFADYLEARAVDLRLPLVADYCGAMINVSFKGVDKAHGRVDFYAPVFSDIDYRLARHGQSGATEMPADGAGAAFSCNCVLNYLYDGADGGRAAGLSGPMAFGEIAYLLLNQTLVYLAVDRA